MGNSKSSHRLYCEGCDSNYYSVGDATWYTSGTVSRWTGYCPDCCGGSTRTWTWDGNVVKLRCKNCDCTYGVICWNDWNNSSYDTIGFCGSCYAKKKNTATITSGIASIAAVISGMQLLNLSLNVMPAVPQRYHGLFADIGYTTDNNLTTKFYDYEFKQDYSDDITFSLERKYVSLYKMDSPNSITLNYNGYQNKSITITFGTTGSNVHVAVSLDTYKNTKGFRSVYHFGVLLSGNTYTVKDNIKGTISVKNYMMVHLMKDDIVFMLCKTNRRAMAELNGVWCGSAKHGQISHFHKIIGHSVLSASVICKFLVKEQDQSKIPYNFIGLKDHHNSLSIWYPEEDLAVITNCFLFVIRFAKLLKRASYSKKIQIPSAKDIIDWTIGKQKWHNSDIFNHVWDHGKENAKPM